MNEAPVKLAPIDAQTDTWLSGDAVRRMERGEPHPDGQIVIEFKTKLKMHDGGMVLVAGAVAGSVLNANHVALALHETFVEGNLAAAVMRQIHAKDTGDLRGQIKELEEKIKLLQSIIDAYGKDANE